MAHSMDSDDFGLGSGGEAGGGHLQDDDSFDIDASYPPPQKRTAQPRVGVGSSVRSTYGQVRQPYGAASSYRSNISTPSPETSDVDVSLSGSMDQPPYSSALRSSGITRKPSAVSSSTYSTSSRPGLSRSSTMARSRFTEHDDSLEELNPHNEPEYRPRDISRASTLYSSATSKPPLRAAQSMVGGYSMPASRRTAPAEEEVSISFEEDEPDVRASNNTLIKKAQQIQDEEAAKERERISNEQLARDRARLEEALQEAKRGAESEANKKKAAEEAAKAREEEERRRQEEEEEDARAAEEAARLRAEAGVEDEDDKYDDKYDESDEFTEPIKVKSTNSALDALDSVLDDEEAEIERARKQLEEEEEAELRRQAEAESVSVSNSAQLGTAAFLNPPWIKDGDSNSHAAAYDESADLDLARRRQEEYEEEQEEERRRKELEAKKKALEAAVEDSYDEDQEAEPVAAPVQSKLHTTSVSRSVTFASDSASQPAPASAARSVQDSSATTPASGGVPAVFASALSSLDPQVAALVMKAIADQLVAQNTPSRAAPAPAPAMPNTSQRVFDPTQSKQAADDAWQRLLNMRSATTTTASSSLPQPPLVASNTPSWESMLAAVASSQLSKKTIDQDRLFTKRPQSFASPAIVNPYSLPSAQPFGSQYDHPQSRYVNQVLRSGLAPDSQRSSLRIENERDALKRLLSFQPGAPNNAPPIPGASDSLSRAVDEHRSLYLQDQAILNSVLRRVLTAGEQKQAAAELGARAQLKFQDDVHAASERKVSEGVPDDGRGLPADDVIRMLEEGYPFAAHDAWQYASSNTLARSVVLSSEPASQLYTRQVVDRTMRETLSELLSDAKVIAMVKKATLKKLKSRLVFDKQIQIAPQSTQQPNLNTRASTVER